jgi:hypothetical protein
LSLPQDYDTLCRWRCFVISHWLDERNMLFACIEAFRCGLRITRADYLSIVKDYVEKQSENYDYQRRHE